MDGDSFYHGEWFLESDSSNAIRVVNDTILVFEERLILNDVKILMKEVGGQSNMAAHALAKFAFVYDDCFWLEGYPFCIHDIVSAKMVFAV